MPPGGPGYIIVGGKPFPSAVSADPWTKHKLTFPGLRPRERSDLIVLHWTGGEGDAAQVRSSLRAASLSVHFVIDADGRVTQHCDADMMCAHARGMNDRSIGIEVVNRASEKHDLAPRRTLTKEKINGRDVVYTAFFPAQVKAALCLVQALCHSYAIPMVVPMGPGGDVLARRMTADELGRFRGVAGHLHSPQTSKNDPGLAILRAVAAYESRVRIGLHGPAE